MIPPRHSRRTRPRPSTSPSKPVRVPGVAPNASPFRLPDDGLLLIWYATYVLLGAFAHDFMATKVWGNINVGLLLGLAQFLTTFLITGLYIRFANRKLDPAPRRSAPRCTGPSSEPHHRPGRSRATRNPADQHRHLVAFVIVTLAIVIRVSRRNTNAIEYFTGGHAVHRPPERHRYRRRLPVGNQFPRHRRCDRRLRL